MRWRGVEAGKAGRDADRITLWNRNAAGNAAAGLRADDHYQGAHAGAWRSDRRHRYGAGNIRFRRRRLREMAGGVTSACILICDITRPVPNGLFLPILVRELLATGIAAGQIKILVATGLHRPNEGAELAELVGDPWVLRTVEVSNHFARDAAAHVDLGVHVERHPDQHRPPVRGGGLTHRHRPGRAAFHGRLFRRPQGGGARGGPRRDHHHLPQFALHVAPARRQLHPRRQSPCTRSSWNAVRDGRRGVGAEHGDRRPAAVVVRQFRRDRRQPSRRRRLRPALFRGAGGPAVPHHRHQCRRLSARQDLLSDRERHGGAAWTSSSPAAT